jgi:hypothetical protein
MPTIVKRVSNTCVQGTRWRATPNAHRRKDQTVKISVKREETTSPGWLIFTPVNWLSFIALQTEGAVVGRCDSTEASCESLRVKPSDYSVGYGRPPLHSRFSTWALGESGRPPGPRGFKALALKLLGQPLKVTENSRQRTCSKFEAILLQIVSQAARGELRFSSLL